MRPQARSHRGLPGTAPSKDAPLRREHGPADTAIRGFCLRSLTGVRAGGRCLTEGGRRSSHQPGRFSRAAGGERPAGKSGGGGVPWGEQPLRRPGQEGGEGGR